MERPVVVVDKSLKDFTIEKVWLFLATDGHGNEGLIAVSRTPGEWIPLVGTDESRMATYRELAQKSCDSSGMKCNIVEFTTRRVIGQIVPSQEKN